MNRRAQSQETMRSKFLKDTQYKILKNNIKLNYMRDNYTFQIDDFNGSFIIVTKFISKLNLQKELLELASGEIKIQDLQKASQRLGKKSQSAFEEK